MASLVSAFCLSRMHSCISFWNGLQHLVDEWDWIDPCHFNWYHLIMYASFRISGNDSWVNFLFCVLHFLYAWWMLMGFFSFLLLLFFFKEFPWWVYLVSAVEILIFFLQLIWFTNLTFKMYKNMFLPFCNWLLVNGVSGVILNLQFLQNFVKLCYIQNTEIWLRYFDYCLCLWYLH